MAESEEEISVLIERVVKDITNAFKKNPDIDEIGLIPCPEARCNRSPIVLVENKLGIESWCIKFLLPYVHNKLLQYKLRKKWLEQDVLTDVTRTLLLLNPDFATAWNVRKELVLSGTIEPIQDLYLAKLALTKFPKSPETWIHRRWVLQKLTQEASLPCLVNKGSTGVELSEKLQQIVQEEMKVCTEAAGRYPSNYNAWSHRIWVLQHIAKCNVKVLLDELSSTENWVSMHISDHSGFHYRQFLLKSLLAARSLPNNALTTLSLLHSEQICSLPKGEKDFQERQKTDMSHLCVKELALCTDLIETYTGHEALWCHRRHVFFLLYFHSHPVIQRTTQDSSCETLNHVNSDTIAQVQTQVMDIDGVSEMTKQDYSQEIKRLKRGPCQELCGLEAELRFIEKVLTDSKNAEQTRFASAYKKWLDMVWNH
ncbi:protein prenyltransferase alpha subunit repeat-containing protein 1 [Protopterus annectens]|uniref:protein prenyltransferase alpha subunit repeat-containing protein 1 n=1 Tax=Protopterus annectens TaxID=7888 RepID=UPI001CFB88A3|nr:protein prenyltransferase alpha subunit repeat-containing protein 1 [Protopterus annectens]